MTEISENKWPVLETAPAGTLKWITGKLLPGDVQTIFDYLCREFDDKVEKIDKKNSGGYDYRTIKGSAKFSNHASGTAIDLNYNKHQYGKENTFTDKQAEAIRKILKDLSGAVRWGGDYKGTKDDMHFEINVNQKTASDVAKKISGTIINPPPPTVTLKRNAKGDPVIWLQKALNKVMNAGLAIDGNFGPLTETAVKNFQKKYGLVVDGSFGPASREKMLTLYT